MQLDFAKLDGLVPAIVQDATSGEVLMLGFMNREAYEKTCSEKRVCFYSRTRQRLWTKGEESGNYLNVVEMLEDCDRDTLLVKVNPEGPACHTGQRSCFGEPGGSDLDFLMFLQDLLKERKKELPEDSYTAGLFRSGVNRIAQKLGEEAVELVIESREADGERFLNEAADLLFHLMILLVERGYGLEEVTAILKQRH